MLIMKKIILAVLSLFLFVSYSSAQCKRYTKKECFPKIKPFIYNGQLNSAILMPGEKAELMMTFNSGQDYRILACAEEKLGVLGLKVMDKNKNVLFYNKEEDKYSQFWDFNVSSTQELIIEISIDEIDSPNNLVPEGCVSVLIGFKE